MPEGWGAVEFMIMGVPHEETWANSWVKHGMAFPYCRLSLWVEGKKGIKEGAYLGSYSGELWPTAWPNYFVPKERAGVSLTQKGARLLLTAIEKA
jgi:hypothetical protein